MVVSHFGLTNGHPQVKVESLEVDYPACLALDGTIGDPQTGDDDERFRYHGDLGKQHLFR